MRAPITAALILAVLLVACDGDPDVAETPTDPPEVTDPGTPADDADGSPGDEAPPTDEEADEDDGAAADDGEPAGDGAAEDDGEPAGDGATDLDGLTLGIEDVVTAESPIDATLAPSGDVVWLAERGGTVRPLDIDGALGEPIIDLTDDTTTDGERGLLGIAVHPDGEWFYASYTDLDGATQIDEWAIDGDGVDAASRRAVFSTEQPFANHNGGGIEFGPDDNLWLGLGDGGGGGDPVEAGQDWSTVLGSMVRIDPRDGDPYAVPSDNPFAEDADGGAPEAWARGLRNPWRFSFDPAEGTLWIADVGQGDVEEINAVDPLADAGANFGWNEMEGDEPFEGGTEPDDHTAPVHTYRHDDGLDRCSITGGVIYRGSAIPELDGAYLYSDFCDGVVRALTWDGSQVVQADIDLGVQIPAVVGFATDADGEVLVLGLNGDVQRLVPSG